tara:strand:- start:361 stop:462 length:102 start_codon:yes stop_codon:yes gene_type:complete
MNSLKRIKRIIIATGWLTKREIKFIVLQKLLNK